MQLQNGQVQTIVDEVARRLLLRIGEQAGLAGSYAVPCDGLARTDGGHRVDRIYVVDGQDEHLCGVATEAVLRGVEIHARLVVDFVVPGVTLTLVHVVDILDGVGVQHVEREDHYRVAPRIMVGVGIDAALGQRLVGKGVAGTAAYGTRDACLGDIPYRQVQDMLYAVYAVGIRLGLYVAMRLLVRMSAPYIGLARTDRHGQLVANHFAVHDHGDDTVATRGCGIVDGVGARSRDQGVAIGYREVAEGDTLGGVVARIDAQYQHEERINLGLGVVGVERVYIAIRITVGPATP